MNKRILLVGVACVVVALGVVLQRKHGRDSTANASQAAVPDRTGRHIGASTAQTPIRGRRVDVGGRSVDLTDVMSRTHAAFRPLGSAVIGGDRTYGVKLVDHTISIHPESSRQGTRVAASPLELRTVSIGGVEPERGTGFVVREDGHASAEVGDGIEENLRNTERGLEQSWEFEERPHVIGNLDVRISVAGEDYAGTTAGGIHFRDNSVGLGMSISSARWVDAAGTSFEVALKYEAGVVVASVPADVVARSAYPAVLDPTIGPEYDLDAPIVGPAAEDESPVSIGHSAAFQYDFLVVWQDRRRSTDTDMTYDVFAAHVDQTGFVREPLGFILNDVSQPSSGNPQSDGSQMDPQALWLAHPQKYLVMWVDDHLGHKTLQYRTIGATATVPDAATQTFSQRCGMATHEATQPALAENVYNAAGYDYVMVAFRENALGSNYGLICANVSTDSGGVLSAGTTIVVSDHTGNNWDAAVPSVSGDSFTDTSARFLVAYQSNESTSGSAYEIEYAVYSVFAGWLNAHVITSQTGTHGSLNPSVATFGGATDPSSDWVIAYERNSGTVLNQNYDIFVTPIPYSGTWLSGTEFTVSNASGNQRVPSVAGYGPSDTQAFVTWADSRSLGTTARGARINVTSTYGLSLVDGPSSTGSINMAGQAGNNVVSHSDESGGYFTTWPDGRNGSYGDIYGANVPYTTSTNGTVGNYLISKSANKQTAPAIAECGGKYLVAWTDSRNVGSSGKDIYGSILNSDGTVAVSNIQISGASNDQGHPAVACATGSEFFVVWEDFRNGSDFDIYGTGVSFTGTVLNGVNGVALAATAGDGENHPSIAQGTIVGGAGFTVVYELDSLYTEAVEITKTGSVAAGPFLITPKGSQSGIYPDIDFDGTNYLIVWQKYQNLSTPPSDINGASMTPAGVVGTAFAIENNTSDQRYPRVRFDVSGTTATVVFEDDRNLGTGGVDIYGRRVTTAGPVNPTFAIATTANNEYAPKLASRSGSLQEVGYYLIPQNADFNYDVWGQSLNAGALSGVAFSITAATTAREMTPAIACGTTLSCVVPYRWFLPSDTTADVDRIKARVLSY